MPSLFPSLHQTKYDWNYPAYFDEGTGQAHPNRTLSMTRGKMLGGSSSINYEVYVRGVPIDYDSWNQIGWDWHTVLYYFKKLEGMTDPTVFHPRNAHLHSSKGPVLVSRLKQNNYIQAANENYLRSLEEIGVRRILESNGPDIVGATTVHSTFANGRRSSTAEAYLRPNKNRPNLFVTKFARAIKVLIDGNRAYGVKVVTKEGIIDVYAEKEVIVSAGAIDTPKLLMLSGIGPFEELNGLNIDTIVDLPVGKNMQDHKLALVMLTGRGLETSFHNLQSLEELDAIPVPIQTGFFNVDYGNSQPQLQIFNAHIAAGAFPLLMHGCKTVLSLDDRFCYSLALPNVQREVDITMVVLMHPKSRGFVTLRSKDPDDNPIIHLGYFRDKHDEIVLAKGVKYITRLINTSHFRKVNGKVVRFDVKGCEGIKWGTDKYWRCYVRNAGTTIFHPVGTCAMGKDGVVDERLRVHGVESLRVVDASIMPRIPSANTNAPTMMIGERASDLIKSDHFNL